MQIHRLRTYTKILSEFEIGYLAASFDMEGTIGLTAEKRKDNVRGVRFLTNVCIYNSNYGALEYLQEMLGFGNIFKHGSETEIRREMYRLAFAANQIRHLLPQIMNYLVIKKRQAELVLAYLALVVSGAHTASLYDEFIPIYWELRNINARGKNVSFTLEDIKEHLNKIVARK